MLIILLIITAFILTAGCGKVSFDENAWKAQVLSADTAMLYADHTDENGSFFNPWMLRDNSISTFRNALKLRLGPSDNISDFSEEGLHAVENTYEYLFDGAKNRISYAGHASFIIQMDGSNIFTDPFFSKKAFVVSKKVVIDFDFEKVPKKPVVLISHNHYDHLDEYSVKNLINKDAIFIVPLKLKEFFTELGAKDVHELDWWENIEIEGIKYTFLPSQHWSRRLWQSVNTTLWGSFMIEGSSNIYFSGDSGYFIGFKEFGRIFPIDYALVGVGAYNPRWFMHYAHMNVSEFFETADDLQAKTTVPMHFGIIQLGREPVLYPLYEINKHIDEIPEYRHKVKPLRVGEYIDMKEGVHYEK